jgi:hypothetical protein
MKQKDNPIWQEIANTMKIQMRVAGGGLSVLLIEKDGSVAAMLAAKDDEETKDPRRVAMTLREFEQRLGEMAAHAENEDMDLDRPDSQTFIRDSETGEYHEQS